MSKTFQLDIITPSNVISEGQVEYLRAPSADGSFGIVMAKSVLTNVAFNEGDVMMLDISVKAVGDGSNALVEVAC